MKRLLIANRGEIAIRIAATARAMGLEVAAICSAADRAARHLRHADRALCIGGARPADSYLDGVKVLAAARALEADAIHPGYGFLAENAAFAEAVLAAGLTWIGPPPAAIRAMGQKDAAKRLMAAAGVPVLPGWSGEAGDAQVLAAAIEREGGYPVLIKPVAGGGGKGMQAVERAAELPAALEAARRTARATCGDGRLMVETLLTRPRHVEVQVFADSRGHVVHLFERDCSVQRRHQKVIEEAPAPGLDAGVRAAMAAAAVAAARAIGYVGAGTVEFLLDGEGAGAQFWFMEMNTRLQVEHRVTEAITGVDLVEWQIKVARGEALPLAQEAIGCRGHALELRLYAEAPERGFLPSTGRIEHFVVPSRPGLVVDQAVETGDDIGAFYDPMMAKLVVHGANRAAVLGLARAVLAATEVVGVATNLSFLGQVLAHPEFVAGAVNTGFVGRAAAALLVPVRRNPARAAVMALGAEIGRRPVRPTDPWACGDGWALNRPAVERRRLLVDGVALDLVAEHGADGLRIAIGDEAWTVQPVRADGGGFCCLMAGALVTATLVSRPGKGLAVILDGVLYDIAEVDPFADAGAAGRGGDGVAAPLSGRVVEVCVAAGAVVARGARLVLLEAMKMEHWLLAPRDGVVGELRCTPGEQVAEGAELIRLAPAD